MGNSPEYTSRTSNNAGRRKSHHWLGMGVAAALAVTLTTGSGIAHADRTDNDTATAGASAPASQPAKPVKRSGKHAAHPSADRTAAAGTATKIHLAPKVSAALNPAGPAAATVVSVPVAAQKAAAKASKGPILGLFGNGTADHPNAGLIAGNGYSYGNFSEPCATGKVCNGGNAGFLFGDGGDGANGGRGGNAGLFGTHITTLGLIPIPLVIYSIGGTGGNAPVGCKGAACNGGAGGNANPLALLTSKGGNGGNTWDGTGGVPGKGGKGGLLSFLGAGFGNGGDGGSKYCNWCTP